MIFTKWKNLLLFFCFYAFIAAALIAPISSDTFIPALADYINHLSGIIQANFALNEGQFPLRIAPMEQSGWRYPYYQFYSPSTYLFSALIYRWLTPSNPLIAYKITAWVALVIAGIYMERLAFWFVKLRPVAVLASIVYLFSPYYIIVVNNFSDLSEIMGLALVPAILFYSIKYYIHPHDKKIFLQTSLAWYLIITIHIITFIYTLFFLYLFLILISIKSRRHWKNLISVTITIAFGSLLAMWYLAPIELLGNDLLVSQTFTSSIRFMAFRPTISQLLFGGAFKFKKEIIDNHPAIGWLILFSAAICFYGFLNKLTINKRRADYFMPSLLLSFFIAFLLTWSPINFWQWLPSPAMIGQYSWRLLDQVIWLGALLFAWALCWLFKNKLTVIHVVIGLLLISIMTSPYFPTLKNSNINLQKFTQKPLFIYNPTAYSINFNKNTQYVDSIDSIIIYALMVNNTLQLNTVYFIPKNLINIAESPFIFLEGNLPNNFKDPEKLVAIINDVPIATISLRPGLLKWKIPLNPSLLKQFNSAKALNLQFKTFSKKTVNIAVNKLILSGFFLPQNIMTVQQTQRVCHQQNITTVCKISVPAGIQKIELPIIYYPKLLHITLNNQTISYKSIVYLDSLLTTVTPEAGKVNLVKITFRGLEWANIISWISWVVWLLLLIIQLYRWIKYC